MGYEELNIDSEYRSFRKAVTTTFFIPVLKKSVVYMRAAGFFSSSSLIEISKGITGLVYNNGRILLISSPHLSEDDYKAIQKGYSSREELFFALKKDLFDHQNYFEVQRLNLLANLIKDEILDIRIAFTKKNNFYGMYHEKMGIVQDVNGNRIAFSGSLNESATAFQHNYESIDVFCSWKNEYEAIRVENKLTAFNQIWNNEEPFIDTLEFPEIKEEIIKKYLNNAPNLRIDEEEFTESESKISSRKLPKRVKTPDKISLYDYQDDAINTWESEDFKGIFDMATGTGKTLTALGAIVRLYNHLGGELAVVIVCPFQHLVEQWVEDIRNFGIDPIIGYSKSTQKNWKKNLSDTIRDQKLNISKKKFFCFVTTNASFRTNYVQQQIKKIKGNALIVVDEAHNFGSESLQTVLPPNFSYRLALSATIERYGDEQGTKALFRYFGKRCIHYTLDRAIKEDKLTPYRYYPVVVKLTDSEIEKYIEVSRQIKQCVIQGADGKSTISERGKKLLIKRARIVAGAWNKLNILKEVITPYKDQKHLLVYCGAASILAPDADETPTSSDELRQISQVTDMLGNQLNMKVSQFTSREDIEERKILKEKFAQGDMLQALIAIKCLDEGVNIPKIKTAFILASTTNPKEYIQRRGRVLRLADGKEQAIIYDFITVPYSVDEMVSLTEEQIDWFKSLITNELTRGFEFARLAINYFDAVNILSELQEAYDVSELTFEILGEHDG